MTREERLAAGWEECWGCYDPKRGWYVGGGAPYNFAPWKRQDFQNLATARTACLPGQKARRFWRRKKTLKSLGQIAAETWFDNCTWEHVGAKDKWELAAQKVADTVRRRDAK